MFNSSQEKVYKIVILGAGFGGIYTFRYLRGLLRGDRGVKLTIINPVNYFLFTPLLHEVATGGVAPAHVVEPIRNVLRARIGEFVLASAYKVLPGEKKVLTTAGEIGYDCLILALGAETNFYDVPGAREFSFTLKSLEDALRLKNHFIRTVEKAMRVSSETERENLLHFVVVGGGATGVELAAEMSEFFYGTFARLYPWNGIVSKVRLTLLERGSSLVPHFHPVLRKKSLDTLRKKQVTVRLSAAVARVEEGRVILEGGETIDTATVIWVAGTRPREIMIEGGAEKDARRAFVAEPTLALKGHADIFVMGDIASVLREGSPLPALAQVATREAKHMARNIALLYKGEPLKDFSYRHLGDLLSLGQWMAIGEIEGFFFSGRLTWWIWRTVYLSKLISWSKKAKVAFDWTVGLFRPRDISEV